MKAVWNERLQLLLRIFLYLVLVIFLLRNIIDIYTQFTATESKPDQVKEQNVIGKPVPVTAQSVAKTFVEQWYSYDPKNEDVNRLKTIQTLVTPDFYQYINDSNIIEYSNQEGQQPPPNQQNQAQNPNPAQNGGNAQAALKAEKVDAWDATWVDEKKGKASIKTRLVTGDQRTLYLSVPVVKSGSSWFVESLPSLVPSPKPKEAGKTQEVDLGEEKVKSIQEMLNSFFAAWLAGNQEATKRYVEKPLPTTNILETVKGEFGNVVDVQVLSEDPVKVKATVSIQEESGAKILYHYFLTLKEKDGNWYIQSINN